MSRDGTYLDRILAAHRAAAAADGRSVAELEARARAADSARGFADALAGGDRLAVIAEVKRRSPSKGDLAPDLDAAALGRAYAEGGAACLSVLTDGEFFGGSPDDLAVARAASGRPVLRKDFTVDARDVLDARLMGADAVLLIVAALDDDDLRTFHDLAITVGLEALVEVHDEAELERALALEPRIVGVNQRDLVTFEVDTERAVRMAPLIPPGVIRVAESGIRDATDAAPLAAAGYHALLVGETLVRSSGPAATLTELRVPRPAPSPMPAVPDAHITPTAR